MVRSAVRDGIVLTLEGPETFARGRVVFSLGSQQTRVDIGGRFFVRGFSGGDGGSGDGRGIYSPECPSRKTD